MGIVLSQLSMPNAFNTVMADLNDMPYFGLDLVNTPGIFTVRNDRVFVRAADLMASWTTACSGCLPVRTSPWRG